MATKIQKTKHILTIGIDELILIIWSLEENKHRLERSNPPSSEQTQQIKDIRKLLSDIS